LVIKGKRFMNTPRRGRATEVVAQLMLRPISEEEVARRGSIIPELRLREDAPAIAVTETTPARQVINSINDERSGAVIVRQNDGTAAAVVVSLDRYMDLVGKELATTASRVATLDGRVVPPQEAFSASHVEQVNPHDPWA
jgi:hypothetical protein